MYNTISYKKEKNIHVDFSLKNSRYFVYLYIFFPRTRHERGWYRIYLSTLHILFYSCMEIDQVYFFYCLCSHVHESLLQYLPLKYFSSNSYIGRWLVATFRFQGISAIVSWLQLCFASTINSQGSPCNDPPSHAKHFM